MASLVSSKRCITCEMKCMSMQRFGGLFIGFCAFWHDSYAWRAISSPTSRYCLASVLILLSLCALNMGNGQGSKLRMQFLFNLAWFRTVCVYSILATDTVSEYCIWTHSRLYLVSGKAQQYFRINLFKISWYYKVYKRNNEALGICINCTLRISTYYILR